MTEAENEIINANYSEFSRKVIQEIRRELVRSGCNPEITYCVEVQEKRYIDSGIVGLHLHLVFQGRKDFRSGWAINPEQIDKIVKAQFEKILERSVDARACNTIVAAKTDLLTELGKYISKGGKLIAKIIRDGKGHLLPTAWWGMTKTLKAKVLSAIIKFTGEDATYFWDNIADLPIKYWLVRLSAAYGNYPVAKVGWITDKSYLATMYNIYNYT
jgi:hypothetical protein